MNALNHLLGTATFWLPRQASETAAELDQVFYFIYYLSVLFFVGIISAMVYFAFKYRRKEGQKTSPLSHSNVLEFWWTIIPTVLLVVMFIWGFKAWITINVPPADAMEIKVTAWKWGWKFTYQTPEATFESSDLYAPEGKAVKLVMTSNDVIHSFYLPEFRLKRDVLPNRMTVLWFRAKGTTGDKNPYNVFCTEYCGQQHSMMTRKAYIYSQEQYDAWVAKKVKDALSDKPPHELGKELYTSSGCVACHSVDGSRAVGPSFKGRYNLESEFADGSKAKVDDAYLRESILYPEKKIVKSYPKGQMPSYKGQLSDTQVNGLVAYIKSLNQKK